MLSDEEEVGVAGDAEPERGLGGGGGGRVAATAGGLWERGGREYEGVLDGERLVGGAAAAHVVDDAGGGGETRLEEVVQVDHEEVDGVLGGVA